LNSEDGVARDFGRRTQGRNQRRIQYRPITRPTLTAVNNDNPINADFSGWSSRICNQVRFVGFVRACC
jgi:hypothetical protein